MRFPAGDKCQLYKGVHPREVLENVDTGYVRLTVDNNGLDDHYVLFSSREIVGALCEFADDRKLQSTEAVDYVLSLNEPTLAEIVTYQEKIIDQLRRAHPEIFVSPETVEKFKVGTTIFEGTLTGIKSGDLINVLTQLKSSDLTGCLRVTRETEESIHEGVVLFLKKPVAALLESGSSVRLGDDALREIALSFSEGRVYGLEEEFVEKFLFFNSASRLKSPVEEVVASEKASEDLKRFMALKKLGLDRGTLVLNAPCNGTFSFEALLRSAASRNFDGYLWVRSEHSRGLMVLAQGKIQAAYAKEPSEELTGLKALRKIYQEMESAGAVGFYQLSSPPHITQDFEPEGSTDDFLVKKLLGEMGGDLIKEVSLAKEFKKRWKTKRDQQGE